MIDNKIRFASTSAKIESGKPVDYAIKEIIQVEKKYHYTDKNSRSKKGEIREIVAKYITDKDTGNVDK